MKNLFKSALSVAVASIFAIGCTEVLDENYTQAPAEGTHTVKATATIPQQLGTRTVIGDLQEADKPENGGYYAFSWDNKDKESIFVSERVDYAPVIYTSQSEANRVQAASTDGHDATFNVNQKEGYTNYDYYAYYPFEAVKQFYHTGDSDSDDRLAYIVFPQEQHPAIAKSVDPAGAVMYAEAVGLQENAEINFTFKHVAAYGHIILTNVPAGETVANVRFTALTNEDGTTQQALAGYYTHYHGGDNDADNAPATDEFFTNSSVTVYYDNAAFDGDVWFTTMPTDVIENFSVRVEMKSGRVFRRQFKAQEGFKFTEGKVLSFGVSLANAAEVLPPSTGGYVLVKDVKELNGTNNIIIASGTSGSIKAMGATSSNGNNRTAVTATVVNETLTTNDDVYIFELKCDNDKYTFFDKNWGTNGGYLYAGSSGSNYLNTKESVVDANAQFTIEIDATTGSATVKATGSNTRNWMRYNSSSTMFACYSSGQNNIYIFKEAAASDGIIVSVDGKEIDAATPVQLNAEGYGPADNELTFKTLGDIKVADVKILSFDGVISEAEIIGDGELMYFADANYSSETRKGEIVLGTDGGDVVAIVNFEQAGSTFAVSPVGDLVLSYYDNGGKINITSPDFDGEIKVANNDGCEIKFTQTSFTKAETANGKDFEFTITDADEDNDSYVGMITVVRKGENEKSAAKILVWHYASGSLTAPKDIAYEDLASNSITVSWEPVNGADSYVLRIAKSNDAAGETVCDDFTVNESANLSDGKVSYTAVSDKFVEGETYYLYVKSVASDGSESVWSSAEVSFVVPFGEKTITFAMTDTTVTIDDITYEAVKLEASNAPAIYGNELRIYRYAGINITAANSRTIKKIVLTFSSSSYTGSNFGLNGSTGTYSLSGTTGTWTGSSSNVNFINTGTTNVQARITEIEVTYM